MAVYNFSGGPVEPAFVSYKALEITGGTSPLQLYWPTSYQDSPNVVAQFIDVTVTAAGLELVLPPANQVGVGTAFIVNSNLINTENFTIETNTGLSSWIIAPGEQFYFILTNNIALPLDGSWIQVQYGAGTTQAQASALAGNGLEAVAGKLNSILLVSPQSGSSYNVVLADACKIIEWTGGSGTITMPSSSTPGLANGFYIGITNNGTGTVTLTADVLLQGQTSISIGMGNSFFVIFDGTRWVLVGYQSPLVQQLTVTNIPLSNSNITLTTAQAANSVIQFTGTLTGNVTVSFPNLNREWIVANNTTGAFTVTLQLTSPIGTPIVINQGSRFLFYSDGSSLFAVPNTSYVTYPLLAPNGIAPIPYSFQTSPTTGMFYDGTNLGFSNNSIDTLLVTSTGQTRVPTTSGAAYSFASFPTWGMGISALGPNLRFYANSAVSIDITTTGITHNSNTTFTSLLGPNGTAGAPPYTFTAATNTGMYLASTSPNTLGFSAGGVAGLTITPTAINFLQPVTFTNILVGNGTAGAPSYSFVTDPATGIYLPSIGTLGLSAGATAVMSATSSSIDLLQVTSGVTFTNNTSPSYTFTGNTTTGMNYNTSLSRLNLITSGVSALQISNAQVVSLTNPLAATSGGTGLASYVVGDTLYANTTTTLSKLSIGGTNQLYTVTAGIPAWTSDITVNTVTNATAANNTTPTYRFSSFTTWGMGFNSTATGTLNLITAGVSALQISNAQAVTLTNPLGVASGGTSFASYTTGDMLYASGTTTLTKLAIATTAGATLAVNAGATAPGWTGHGLLSIPTIVKATTVSATQTNTTFQALTTPFPGFQIAITPSATNSKVLITASMTVSTNGSGRAIYIQIWRNGSALSGANGTGSTISAAGMVNLGSNSSGTYSFQYVDSPASTSAQTYTLATACDNATGGYVINGYAGTGNSVACCMMLSAYEIGGF